MTAAALLAELRAAGIVLAVDGDRLVARGRRLPPDLAERLRAAKAELVVLLTRSQCPQNPQFPPPGVPGAGSVDSVDDSGAPAPLAAVVEAVAVATTEPVAWRLYSRTLDRELWVYRDLAALRDLEREGLGGLPAVHGDDLERLRGWSAQRLADLLEALTVFPKARLANQRLLDELAREGGR